MRYYFLVLIFVLSSELHAAQPLIDASHAKNTWELLNVGSTAERFQLGVGYYKKRKYLTWFKWLRNATVEIGGQGSLLTKKNEFGAFLNPNIRIYFNALDSQVGTALHAGAYLYGRFTRPSSSFSFKFDPSLIFGITVGATIYIHLGRSYYFSAGYKRLFLKLPGDQLHIGWVKRF